MTVNSHETFDPPVPGGNRGEVIRGSLTLSTGTASETITLELDYDSIPYVTATAVSATTAEEVTATLTDADPTADDTITVRLDGATDEAKDYHVQVLDLLEPN